MAAAQTSATADGTLGRYDPGSRHSRDPVSRGTGGVSAEFVRSRMGTGLSTLKVPARERLIVALDYETIEEARDLVDRIGDAVDFYKVGWELMLTSSEAFGGYVNLIRDLGKDYGKKVMADLKILDIPETVRRTMRQLKQFDNVEFVTFHAQEYAAIEAAVEEKNGARVLAVLLLTSMTEKDLELQGIKDMTVEEVVLHRAAEALVLQCDGVISSGQETQALRARFGYENFVITTPGIRDKDAPKDDQKRRATVEEAFQNGSDYIVIGREIRDAADPRAAAEAIQERIASIFPDD
jgi:orotidine-5'-phosphate decarboxylase